MDMLGASIIGRELTLIAVSDIPVPAAASARATSRHKFAKISKSEDAAFREVSASHANYKKI